MQNILKLSSLLALVGCAIDSPRPEVGDCASQNDGRTEFGQIGIGTCLAGPTELAWAEDGTGGHVLLVTNANPYGIFSGGSLLAIPWDGIDLGTKQNLVHEVASGALDLPDYAGGLAIDGELGLVAVRLSEDSRVRSEHDDVHLVDLTNPALPARSNRGEGGDDTITVQADPVDVVLDADGGRAFVANRTSHSISVLDLTGETVEIVLPWPEQTLTAASFLDADGSGSTAEMAKLEVFDPELVPDESWTLSWIEGSWRVWAGGAEGISRWNNQGGTTHSADPMGIEFDPVDLLEDDLTSAISDPDLEDNLGLMALIVDGQVHVATPDAHLGDWSIFEEPAFSPSASGWDAAIGGPALLLTDERVLLFYDGAAAEGEPAQGIGMASSADGLSFGARRQILSPSHDHESGAIADPAVVFDGETETWHMFYGAHDGSQWTIGHATSTDLESWTTDSSPSFALDGWDVAAPVVTREAGRWRMWTAQSDGVAWHVGLAESHDGQSWREIAARTGRSPRALRRTLDGVIRRLTDSVA
jgi:hypothetical protein